MALALLLGLAGGVGLVLVRGGSGRGVATVEELEGGVGLPVYASVPRSRAERRLARARRRRTAPVLATASPADAAVEDLRGLRTAVQFALRTARNNVVVVGGLAPRAGKSFVSVNLAHLLVAAHGRVLVVDADLRRGVLDRLLGVEGKPGLTDVLGGAAELDAAVRPTGTQGLDVLPAGTPVAHGGELLAGDRLERVLAEAGRRYAVVLVDTPPVLAVADSALIGRHAGVNLMVLRAGEHTVAEITAALRRLSQGGVVVRAAVLNDVRPAAHGARRWRRYRAAYGGT
jgi:tyrosine-protein kinase Etk/Wzc